MDSIYNAFSKPIIQVLPKLPNAALALLFGYLALFIVSKLIKWALRLVKVEKAVKQMMMSIVNTVLWAILLALVFQSLGLPQIALALSGSVALFGILLASGANFLVSDILSGLFLAKDPDFRIGETIKAADFEGVVERIDLRKVRIRNKDGHLHIIPNSVLDKAQFIVLDENKK